MQLVLQTWGTNQAAFVQGLDANHAITIGTEVSSFVKKSASQNFTPAHVWLLLPWKR